MSTKSEKSKGKGQILGIRLIAIDFFSEKTCQAKNDLRLLNLSALLNADIDSTVVTNFTLITFD